MTWTEIQSVQTGTTTETRYNSVDVYVTETYTVDVPVYETQDVEVTVDVPVYETVTYTWLQWEFSYPELVTTEYVNVSSTSGTIYIDGRITRLYGDLNGRLTVVGNEKVRVTGTIRYVDDSGRTAMLNGDDYRLSYKRNLDYQGTSVLGVVARGDVVLTSSMPYSAEVNATLMSVDGRVGIEGLAIDSNGEPTTNYFYGLTSEELAVEQNYERTSYHTHVFVKDSLRRIGGIISNDRIVETYIRPRSDGTAYVAAGFKRGQMKFDINLLFNPPPNFVEVPRPVITSFVPIFLVV